MFPPQCVILFHRQAMKHRDYVFFRTNCFTGATLPPDTSYCNLTTKVYVSLMQSDSLGYLFYLVRGHISGCFNHLESLYEHGCEATEVRTCSIRNQLLAGHNGHVCNPSILGGCGRKITGLSQVWAS